MLRAARRTSSAAAILEKRTGPDSTTCNLTTDHNERELSASQNSRKYSLNLQCSSQPRSTTHSAEETVRRRGRSLLPLLTPRFHLTGVFFSTVIGGAFAFGVGLNIATDAFWDRWNKGVSVPDFLFTRPSVHSWFRCIEAVEGY